MVWLRKRFGLLHCSFCLPAFLWLHFRRLRFIYDVELSNEMSGEIAELVLLSATGISSRGLLYNEVAEGDACCTR